MTQRETKQERHEREIGRSIRELREKPPAYPYPCTSVWDDEAGRWRKIPLPGLCVPGRRYAPLSDD